MKRLPLILTVTVVFLSVSFFAYAKDVRFGVVDMVRVLENSEAGKKAKDELSSRIDAAESDIVKRQEELLALKEEIEKQTMMLSAEALAKKEREYQDKLLEYQRKLQDYNYELQNRQYELLEVIITEADSILQEIAVEGDYSLIFERTNSGVLYFHEDIDLTDDIIRALDK